MHTTCPGPALPLPVESVHSAQIGGKDQNTGGRFWPHRLGPSCCPVISVPSSTCGLREQTPPGTGLATPSVPQHHSAEGSPTVAQVWQKASSSSQEQRGETTPPQAATSLPRHAPLSVGRKPTGMSSTTVQGECRLKPDTTPIPARDRDLPSSGDLCSPSWWGMTLDRLLPHGARCSGVQRCLCHPILWDPGVAVFSPVWRAPRPHTRTPAHKLSAAFRRPS